MLVQPTRRLFTAEEYHRMGEAGILHDDDRVELIEGEIVEMAPIGSPHAGTVDRLNRLFTSRLGERAIVRVQGPVLLAAVESEPEPDLALLLPRPDFYTTGHPEPPDVLLALEVMDTSVERDRRVKLPLYARAGIAETWLVDLNTGCVEVYRRPGPAGYQDSRVARRGESLAPHAFPDVALAVADLLG
ncbi:MAG TPA: Uma2 family endonuclease [Candidatus Rokubacteria bacterium]|nr:Uma2 family endonuclease [Candidatus Rokubacteria bacterium]